MNERVGQPSAWTPSQRVAYRCLISYLVLYFFPLPQGLADPEWVSAWLKGFWVKLVSWVGLRFFHVAVDAADNGSGDKLFDYLRVLCILVLALAAGAVWSWLDRRRPHYRTLDAWIRVWLRYVLVFSMVTYGMVKVIKLQFPSPGYYRLNEAYGDSSPMGLLWTFMGYSTPYTFFAGAMELLGAFLLCFRRTVTLGALVLVGVMGHVVLLNFCYDVPVKLGSTHLLLLAFFLLWPGLRALVDLLVRHRPAVPPPPGPEFRNPRLRQGAQVLKGAVLTLFVGWQTQDAMQASRSRKPPAPPFGVMVVDGPADSAPWKAFALQSGYFRTYLVNGRSELYKVDGNPLQGAFGLWALGENGEPVPGAGPVGRLVYDLSGTPILEGVLEGRDLKVKLQRPKQGHYLLTSRGFHWISPAPFNR